MEKYSGKSMDVYVALATPVLTDISSLLDAPLYLDCEPGGTLEFQNALGTDYRIPVESNVRYMIDLVEATDTATE